MAATMTSVSRTSFIKYRYHISNDVTTSVGFYQRLQRSITGNIPDNGQKSGKRAGTRADDPMPTFPGLLI
jgi:hypothetical protein